MPPALETLTFNLPADLIGELADLGRGDTIHGIRIALSAAKELTSTTSRDRLDPQAPVLRFLHPAETVARHIAVLERHIERYEFERKAFLDDVARLGRINEENTP